MATTLRWLIENSKLENLKCVACKEKLDTEISGVNILDNPDTAKWLKSRELVLTSGYLFSGEASQQVQLIRDLSKAGCCAVGIKTRRFFQSVPEAMINEAEKLGFPIIELPFFYSFSDIIRVVYEQIFAQRTARQKRELSMLSMMTGPLFANGSISDMMSCISRQYKTTVVYVNKQGIRVAASFYPGMEIPLPERFEGLAEIRNGEAFLLKNENFTYPFLVVSLKGDFGSLLIHNPANSLQSELIPLQHAGAMISVKLEQRKYDRHEKEGNSSGFMQMLMNPNEEMSDEEIQHVCEIHDFDTSAKRICLAVISGDELSIPISAMLRESASRFISKLPDHEEHPIRGFIAGNSSNLAIFLLADHQTSNPALMAAARELAEHLIALPELQDTDFRIAIGQCHQTLGNLPHSLEECRSVLSLIGNIFPDNRIFTSTDSMTYQLLNRMSESQLREIYFNTVAVLAQHDAVNHTDLLKTLDVLFSCQFNAQQAAKQLYVHRNTMMNRIAKIHELLHCDLKDMTATMNIYLGLCVYKILNPM